MLTPQFFIYFLLAMTQFISGVFANGFIVVVSVIDWIRQRQMAPLDLLISCLATSRLGMQVFNFFTELIILFFIKQLVVAESFAVYMFVKDLELWLSTWLGVFYCAKIATIPHPLFFWLKRRISRLVPWLILGSVLYASVCIGLHRKYTWTFTEKFFVNSLLKNATEVKEINTTLFSLLFIHLTVPLTIFLTAALLLIFSLGRHTQQMRTVATGTRNCSRGGPIKAMLSILSFLVLYFSQHMIFILLFYRNYQFGSFLVLFCNLVVGTYPSIHSIILILGSPKLKQSAKRFLLCGQCGQREACGSV